MIASLARAVGRDEVGPEVFNAPLFGSIIDRVPEHQRWVVLDLGAACPQVISLFGGHHCRLDIADIASGLAQLDACDDPDDRRDVAEALLPAPRDECTDVVLCWDLPNYLRRESLAALMSRIARRGRPGTLLHTLICYSYPRMPVQPGHYVPQADGGLVNLTACEEMRDAPRYSPEDLNHCLRDFTVERAMLLGNGMQEFLFRL